MENADLLFIRAILENDSRMLEKTYRTFLPVVFGMLRRNNGTYEDAKDIFQEALVVIFHHASRPQFRLTSSFHSYLLGICRFIWLRQLKKNARTEVTSDDIERYDMEDDLEQKIFESEKHNLYREKFALLGDDCRQLLQRFFDREALGRIAADMGYTDDYVKKKNRVCKEKLLGMIQNDPRFAEIARGITKLKTDGPAHEK